MSVIKPSSKKEVLRRLLDALKEKGVEHGSRNRVVAEKTGYSEKTVGNLLAENSKLALTDRFLKAVCGAFEISIFWIVKGCNADGSTQMPQAPVGADKYFTSLTTQELRDFASYLSNTTEPSKQKDVDEALMEWRPDIAEELSTNEYQRINKMTDDLKLRMIKQITMVLLMLYAEEVGAGT